MAKSSFMRLQSSLQSEFVDTVERLTQSFMGVLKWLKILSLSRPSVFIPPYVYCIYNLTHFFGCCKGLEFMCIM